MATVKICDICGKRPVKTFYFTYDTRYNGVETEVLSEDFDLCFDHTEFLVQLLKSVFTQELPAEEKFEKNRKVIHRLAELSKHRER